MPCTPTACAGRITRNCATLLSKLLKQSLKPSNSQAVSRFGDVNSVRQKYVAREHILNSLGPTEVPVSLFFPCTLQTFWRTVKLHCRGRVPRGQLSRYPMLAKVDWNLCNPGSFCRTWIALDVGFLVSDHYKQLKNAPKVHLEHHRQWSLIRGV